MPVGVTRAALIYLLGVAPQPECTPHMLRIVPHQPPRLRIVQITASTESMSSMLRPAPGALDSVHSVNRPRHQRND